MPNNHHEFLSWQPAQILQQLYTAVLTVEGGKYGPLGLLVPTGWVKEFPDCGLSQMFPTESHGTFGAVESSWLLVNQWLQLTTRWWSVKLHP